LGNGLSNTQNHAEEGSADALTLEGENLFRACSPGYHRHLICRECGTTEEIEA